MRELRLNLARSLSLALSPSVPPSQSLSLSGFPLVGQGQGSWRRVVACRLCKRSD